MGKPVVSCRFSLEPIRWCFFAWPPADLSRRLDPRRAAVLSCKTGCVLGTARTRRTRSTSVLWMTWDLGKSEHRTTSQASTDSTDMGGNHPKIQVESLQISQTPFGLPSLPWPRSVQGVLLVDLFPQNSHMVHMAFQFMAVGLGMTCAGVNTTALVKKKCFCRVLSHYFWVLWRGI